MSCTLGRVICTVCVHSLCVCTFDAHSLCTLGYTWYIRVYTWCTLTLFLFNVPSDYLFIYLYSDMFCTLSMSNLTVQIYSWCTLGMLTCDVHLAFVCGVQSVSLHRHLVYILPVLAVFTLIVHKVHRKDICRLSSVHLICSGLVYIRSICVYTQSVYISCTLDCIQVVFM